MKCIFWCFLSAVMVTIFLCSTLNAQMLTDEGVVQVNLYKGTFQVNGDKDTYYPVVFKYGNQNIINHIRIYRSYNEGGPVELSPTHKGGLTLEIDVNYGGWGGAVYDWRIMDLRQKYHNTFAYAAIGMHSYGFIVWLRGGGFIYHYESDKPAHLQVAYSSSELIYDHELDDWDVAAPEPLTEVQWDAIYSHKVDRIEHLKGAGISNWNTNGNDIYHDSGNVGIGITSPVAKLDIHGNMHLQDNLTIDTDISSAINIRHWNRFGSTKGGHYPYWGMNIFHDDGEWNSFHSSLRGSLIFNHGNRIDFASAPANTKPAPISTHMRIDTTTGNVGIGTTSPSARLDVYGGESAYGNFHVGGVKGGIVRFRTGGTNKWGFLSEHPGTDKIGLYDYVAAGGSGYRMVWDTNGNVGIGTTDPQSKLSVNGTITAKEIKVESGWSDFVFDDAYELPLLSSVEYYIKEHKHLPDIPSAKEVEQKGLAVSGMLAKQMQKIEELTLYIIAQNRKIEELEKQLATLIGCGNSN